MKITEYDRVIQDLLNVVDDLTSALTDATQRYEYRDIKASASRVYEEARKFLYAHIPPND